jgi:hypothetical protein
MAEKKVSYRSLNKVKELIELMGFAISYPFDDLVFVDTNAFLIQYDDLNDNKFNVHFNTDLDLEAKNELMEQFKKAGEKKALSLEFIGLFNIQPSESEGQIDIVFSN